ncbi:hypothetical protein TNCV_1415401 [Trichonephila clavipes]|nr:hypothetical protein TNCV_1415401 [Trichonephila clavipes]
MIPWDGEPLSDAPHPAGNTGYWRGENDSMDITRIGACSSLMSRKQPEKEILIEFSPREEMEFGFIPST